MINKKIVVVTLVTFGLASFGGLRAADLTSLVLTGKKTGSGAGNGWSANEAYDPETAHTDSGHTALTAGVGVSGDRLARAIRESTSNRFGTGADHLPTKPAHPVAPVDTRSFLQRFWQSWAPEILGGVPAQVAPLAQPVPSVEVDLESVEIQK